MTQESLQIWIFCFREGLWGWPRTSLPVFCAFGWLLLRNRASEGLAKVDGLFGINPSLLLRVCKGILGVLCGSQIWWPSKPTLWDFRGSCKRCSLLLWSLAFCKLPSIPCSSARTTRPWRWRLLCCAQVEVWNPRGVPDGQLSLWIWQLLSSKKVFLSYLTIPLS